MNDHHAARAGDRDRRAALRDVAAEERDLRAMARDRRARESAGDQDEGFAARYLSAVDRDSAAGDRADSCADRAAARAASQASRRAMEPPQHRPATTPVFSDGSEQPFEQVRPPVDRVERSAVSGPGADLYAMLDARHLLLEAQGMVMAARGVSANDAAMLLLLAARLDPATLLSLAVGLADSGRRPDPSGRGQASSDVLDGQASSSEPSR